MAVYYDRTNQLDSAILHYKKRIELIKQHSIYSVEDFREVSEIFERMGDLTSALVYESTDAAKIPFIELTSPMSPKKWNKNIWLNTIRNRTNFSVRVISI